MQMAKETLHIFDLGDLIDLRFQCNHCQGEVVQSIFAYKLLKQCPLCAQEWEEQRPPYSPMDPNALLARAIQGVLETKGLPMTIRFEIDCKAEEKTG